MRLLYYLQAYTILMSARCVLPCFNFECLQQPNNTEGVDGGGAGGPNRNHGKKQEET